MKKINTFSDKTRQDIFNSQNGMCKTTLDPIHSFHHMLPNTKPNRKRFPLFIHSPFNCVGLGFHEHTHKKHKYRIKEELAKVYEDYLRHLIIDLPF